MTNEEICTKFMREHYSDERLATLLAHAEDGKLNYYSCCCFVGVPNANHPLQESFHKDSDHCYEARNLEGANDAEGAFMRLGFNEPDRRAAIIPLIRAEMARRDALRPANPDQPVLELMHFSGCNEDGDGGGE